MTTIAAMTMEAGALMAQPVTPAAPLPAYTLASVTGIDLVDLALALLSAVVLVAGVRARVRQAGLPERAVADAPLAA